MITFAPANQQGRIFAIQMKSTGEVLEWLKRHAWKACNRQNWFAGSNPVLSAESSKIMKRLTILIALTS